MSIKLTELYPIPITFSLHAEEYELLPFTLKKELWVLKSFDSLEKFNEALVKPNSERPFLLFEFIYELLKDSPFKTIDSFLKKVLSKGRQGVIEATKQASISANNSLLNAMPLVKSVTRTNELKEIQKAKGESVGANYALYYDKIARRYGYTLDDFLNLTTRQLFFLLKAIDDGDYAELEVKAALAGRKLKPRLNELDISEDQDKENMKAAEEMLKRMEQRHKEIINGK